LFLQVYSNVFFAITYSLCPSWAMLSFNMDQIITHVNTIFAHKLLRAGCVQYT